jgi:hypothetical protein
MTFEAVSKHDITAEERHDGGSLDVVHGCRSDVLRTISSNTKFMDFLRKMGEKYKISPANTEEMVKMAIISGVKTSSLNRPTANIPSEAVPALQEALSGINPLISRGAKGFFADMINRANGIACNMIACREEYFDIDTPSEGFVGDVTLLLEAMHKESNLLGRAILDTPDGHSFHTMDLPFSRKWTEKELKDRCSQLMVECRFIREIDGHIIESAKKGRPANEIANLILRRTYEQNQMMMDGCSSQCLSFSEGVAEGLVEKPEILPNMFLNFDKSLLAIKSAKNNLDLLNV